MNVIVFCSLFLRYFIMSFGLFDFPQASVDYLSHTFVITKGEDQWPSFQVGFWSLGFGSWTGFSLVFGLHSLVKLISP